jgi:phage tail sheath protein FI
MIVRELDEGYKILNEERFLNLSVDPANSRYIGDVLKQSSRLVRLKDPEVNSKLTQVPNANTATDGNGNLIPTMANGDGSDGFEITANEIIGTGLDSAHKGLWALDGVDLFNILCIPPFTAGTDVHKSVWATALKYCDTRRAMLIVDPPIAWREASNVKMSDIDNLRGTNAALYFPRVKIADPLKENRLGEFAPCGVVAGIWARTDAQRGVWKAPAGQDATMIGVQSLSYDKITDGENGLLNPLGINCLRTFPVTGNVVWGARTREGADQLASEWKYVPIRRLALYIEESLYRGTQWVVFEPNDEPLWSQIRLNVGTFMHNLFRQGAFQGTTPRDAYFVKCNKDTTTQADIDRGIVNILVGFAPLKPAEFVIINIQQMAGQTQS